MSLRKVLLATTFLSVVPLLSAPAMAQDVSMDDIAAIKQENAQLQKSLARLMRRLNRLEKKSVNAEKIVKRAEKVADSAVTQSKDGGFQLPGGTTVKFGGYAKLDVIHDVQGRSTTSAASNASDAVGFGSIPVSTDSNLGERDGSTRVHARQTRLNMKTSTPSDWGDIGTFVEFDFFGTAGSALVNNPHTPRLRHAFVTFNDFLVGQTWSSFIDLSVVPDTLDFNGPISNGAIRQAQIRYTAKLDDGHQVILAVENSESDVLDSAAATNTDTINHWPDLIAKYRYDGSDGHVALAGVLRNIAYDQGGIAGTNEKDKWGYGLGLTGKYRPFDGDYAKDSVFFQLVGGDGVGRYITEAANSGAALNRADGALKTQFAWGGFVGMQHYWMPNLRSSLVYGHADIDLESYIASSATKKVDSLHANFIWTPMPKLDLGVEYIYGRRSIKSGASGEVNRVQGSVKYSF